MIRGVNARFTVEEAISGAWVPMIGIEGIICRYIPKQRREQDRVENIFGILYVDRAALPDELPIDQEMRVKRVRLYLAGTPEGPYGIAEWADLAAARKVIKVELGQPGVATYAKK
jgi:hypothetical protein